MKWSETKQAQFDKLRQRELAVGLSKSEQAELAQLHKWLTESADEALSPAVDRLEQERDLLRKKLKQRQAENEQLAQLLHQQEELLVDSRRWLTEFDKRQQQISHEFTRLTGDVLTPA